MKEEDEYAPRDAFMDSRGREEELTVDETVQVLKQVGLVPRHVLFQGRCTIKGLEPLLRLKVWHWGLEEGSGLGEQSGQARSE